MFSNQSLPDRFDPSDVDSIFYMEYMEDQKKELSKICNKISFFKTLIKTIFNLGA